MCTIEGSERVIHLWCTSLRADVRVLGSVGLPHGTDHMEPDMCRNGHPKPKRHSLHVRMGGDGYLSLQPAPE